MSFCRKEGKDVIIFATEEYLSTPSTVNLLPDNPEDIDRSNVGAILPSGEINWECPCLGNLPNGPCGPNFREAFSCWVENREDEATFADKCFDNFVKWETCLSEHKDIYKSSSGESNVNADSEVKNNADYLDNLSANKETKLEVESGDQTDSKAVTNETKRAIGAASISK